MKDFALPKPDRLKLIIALLREQSFVKRSEISRICSTSTKTAQRDIDTLREQRWPIEKTQQGYYLRDASIAEKKASVNEHFAVLMIAGCSIDKNIGSLMPGVGATLKKEVFRLSEVEEVEDALVIDRSVCVPQSIYSKGQLKTFGILARNIIAELAISFEYTTIGYTQAIQRSVYPIQLKLKESIWYLLGWDLNRDAMRIFTLNKIQSVAVLKATWKRPSISSINDVLKSGDFSIWDRGGAKVTVSLKVSSYAKEFVLNQKLAADQVVEDVDGRTVVTLQTSDLIGINIWCRKFCPDVEILEPTSLKESFVADLQTSIATNSNEVRNLH